MHALCKTALAVACAAVAAQAAAQVTFYEHDNFSGRSFTTTRAVDNLTRYGFNDRASSVIVSSERWEVCQDATYGGHCVVLRQGRYASLAAMGLNDRVSSVRAIDGYSYVDTERYAPAPEVVYDYRRRGGERLYEANVTAVHAVLGPPENRCWVEAEAMPQERRVGGALLGGLVGGILGHQIGSGTGNTLATVGGAMAGAAVGSHMARNAQGQTVETQHCEMVQNQSRPSYWDVSYEFRGRQHQVQMTAPPGPTVTVNHDGEPRA